VSEIKDHYKKIEEPISNILKKAGNLAKESRIRLSSHPAQFTVLASNRSEVVRNSIEDLEYHAKIFKLMEIEASDAIINIHLQGLYSGTHEAGITRFATHYGYLDDYTQMALTVENEDKPNGYDIAHTLELAQRVPIRCMLDVHHYYCWRKGQGHIKHTDDFFKEFLKTWGRTRPAMHKSQSKLQSKRMNEHSDEFHDDFFTNLAIPMLEYTDIECELKSKWTGVLKFYNKIKEYETQNNKILQLK
jgi:UV DNA damage endonuclease